MNVGPLELGIVLVIILLIFGPKRLPGLGRSIGSGMREFKDAITRRHKDDDDLDARLELPEESKATDGDQASRP